MPRHTATRLAALALAQCRAPSVSHAGRLPPSLAPWRALATSSSSSTSSSKREANAAAARRARLAAETARGQGSAASGGLYLAALAVGMVGVTYASVPLYRMFCQATGFGGTTRRRTLEDKLAEQRNLPESVKAAAANREVVISFNADVAEGMPWRFVPTQRSVRVRPGETTLAFFTAKNRSDRDVTGVATLPEGVEMVMPGDNVNLAIELITPIACEQGLRFAIREGGRTVGSGIVTSIQE